MFCCECNYLAHLLKLDLVVAVVLEYVCASGHHCLSISVSVWAGMDFEITLEYSLCQFALLQTRPRKISHS